MSDITDLCAIIHRGNWLNFDALAEEIIAAGFHRDRTITTAEELEALPDGSVVRDKFGCVFEVARGSSFGTAYLIPGDDEPQVVVLPVTVLHEGASDE